MTKTLAAIALTLAACADIPVDADAAEPSRHTVDGGCEIATVSVDSIGAGDAGTTDLLGSGDFERRQILPAGVHP